MPMISNDWWYIKWWQLMMMTWCSSYEMIAMTTSNKWWKHTGWYYMMQSSIEPLKQMIVNRTDCIQIEAKQILFWFKCSYKLVKNFTLVVCSAQYNQSGFYPDLPFLKTVKWWHVRIINLLYTSFKVLRYTFTQLQYFSFRKINAEPH